MVALSAVCDATADLLHDGAVVMDVISERASIVLNQLLPPITGPYPFPENLRKLP